MGNNVGGKKLRLKMIFRPVALRHSMDGVPQTDFSTALSYILKEAVAARHSESESIECSDF